jgi:hypothetical protein
MTDLYAVRVLAIDPPRRFMQMRVTVTNPDVWHEPLPEGADFFLNDLGRIETVQDLLDDEDDPMSDDFIETVERTATRNHPFTEEARKRLAEEGGGFDWGGIPRDETTFAHVLDVLRNEELNPGADYDLVVTDPRMFERFNVGDWWNTSANPGTH